jgi:HSP20 family molecular chaperone IbpA
MNFRSSRPTNSYNVANTVDGKYVVSVLIPGYPKEDIKVRLRNGTLQIEANAREEDGVSSYVRLGYALPNVHLSLYVGDDHVVETAKLTNGVLYVTLVDNDEEEPAIIVT